MIANQKPWSLGPLPKSELPCPNKSLALRGSSIPAHPSDPFLGTPASPSASPSPHFQPENLKTSNFIRIAVPPPDPHFTRVVPWCTAKQKEFFTPFPFPALPRPFAATIRGESLAADFRPAHRLPFPLRSLRDFGARSSLPLLGARASPRARARHPARHHSPGEPISNPAWKNADAPKPKPNPSSPSLNP